MNKKFQIFSPTILTGEEMMNEAGRVLRAEVESKRGIIRDRDGKIIRTEEWLRKRIKFLEEKKKIIEERLKIAKEDKRSDLQKRLQLIEAELKEIKSKLK